MSSRECDQYVAEKVDNRARRHTVRDKRRALSDAWRDSRITRGQQVPPPPSWYLAIRIPANNNKKVAKVTIMAQISRKSPSRGVTPPIDQRPSSFFLSFLQFVNFLKHGVDLGRAAAALWQLSISVLGRFFCTPSFASDLTEGPWTNAEELRPNWVSWIVFGNRSSQRSAEVRGRSTLNSILFMCLFIIAIIKNNRN